MTRVFAIALCLAFGSAGCGGGGGSAGGDGGSDPSDGTGDADGGTETGGGGDGVTGSGAGGDGETAGGRGSSHVVLSDACHDEEPLTSVKGGYRRVVVDDAVARGAVCNDGCPYAYYIRPGQGALDDPAADVNKWLFFFFFKGGGGCIDEESCLTRWENQRQWMTPRSGDWSPDSGLDSAKNQCDDPATGDPRGIFWQEASQNRFGGWTVVYLHFCSSDGFAGTREADPDNGFSFHFRGWDIVGAVLEDLQDPPSDSIPDLSDASEVLVTGGSGCHSGLPDAAYTKSSSGS